MADLEDLRREKARWERETLGPAVERHPELKPGFETGSGLPLERLYTAADVAADGDLARHYLERVGFPGEWPFTRGVQPTLYRGQLWTMRQYAGYQSAEDSNRRYRYLLERGQTGLSVAFDLPTQIGYDSDDPLAAGEVGRVGVPIGSLRDMETLLDGIPLEQVSISMTINSTAMVLLSLLIALARRRGLDPARLRGTVQNDILKEYIARGTQRFPPRPSLRLVTDVIAYGAERLPRWHPISISGYHIREAGATAVQELAFTFADGIAYVEAALARGLEIDRFAPHLSFFFNAHNDLLEEVAKFRAARRIWARIVRDRFGAKDPHSLALRFHAQTAGSTLTASLPRLNLVRVGIQALAAALGGCQSLHTNGYDEALGLPTEEAALLALRTQQLVANESGVAGTVDPLGGSHALEALTDRIEREVQAYLERIDARGGTLAAIEGGFIQAEIRESAYRFQRALEEGRAVVVGVNKYAEDGGGAAARPPVLKIDPAVEARRKDGLARLRRERDGEGACKALGRLREAARDERENLVPHVVDCVERLVTIGEICTALASVFGEYGEAGDGGRA